MELSKSDFRANVSDLTKIPPNEFEKYFQEWMERDDIARSLQAKLRCDLIKNFNKTNLGKHILSHNMNSAGSTMRITLCPLVLALNTLVAEFLYAQNCHFTLSVFCTEVPFRNTLPDFENVRRFRFNNEEITEIWQAVTGNSVNKNDLNKNIIRTYEKIPNMSLLMLIIKCLLKKDPLDQLKRNVEVQTDMQEKVHKSISTRALAEDSVDYDKATETKDYNLHYINKYLLILSKKVIEMTKEFEDFVKQARHSRQRTLKSSRSREYYTVNRSLERITENIKALDQAKCRSKGLSKIIVSIENLTQQFCKCSQNFENVTKFVDNKILKSHAKVKLKEKQTETELQEKSYKDWIYEMRNTDNGQKFLNRIDISLRKVLMKHQEQLQNEADIKIKHLKGILKVHYQQKLSKHLLQKPKIQLEETRKCNENIERKLQLFEKKQMDLWQQLKESTLELKEAQVQEQEISKIDEEKVLKPITEENKAHCEIVAANAENVSKLGTLSHDVTESKKPDTTDQVQEEKTSQSSLRSVSNAQEQIMGIAQAIAEQGRSVDRIIYDAKLRIQQLENESYLLDKNFQSYLERSKRSQEKAFNNLQITKVCDNYTDLYQISSTHLRQGRVKSTIIESEEGDEMDEEFQRLKDALEKVREPVIEKQGDVKSNSSTSSLELRNAILEAKLKFFEQENIIRKCREQGNDIRNGNLLQKHLENYSETELQQLSEHLSQKCASETSSNCETENCVKDKKAFCLESSLSEIDIKDTTLDEEQDLNLSPMTEGKSQKMEENTPSARRELFPRDIGQNKKDYSPANDLENYIRYHEPINKPAKNEKKNLKGNDLNRELMQNTGKATELIRQSMTKVQQLFEQQSISQEALSEMVSELEQGTEHQNTTKMHPLRPSDALEKTITSTTTTTITTAISSARPSKECEMKSNSNALESTRSSKIISSRSAPSTLNLSIESEHSIDSNCFEIETTLDPVKDIAENEISKHQNIETMTRKTDSSGSCESNCLSSANKKLEVTEPKSLQEFANENDFNDLPNENEIFEIITESNRTYFATGDKLGENFSSRTSSELDISIGHRNKEGKNRGDGSESDFWS